MLPTAKAMRKLIQPHVDFDFWVRRFNDKSMWVGPEYGSAKRMELLVNVLTQNGFNTECRGIKGTAGEHIIDVVET